MARAGRKAKAGKRTKSGRLVRDTTFDKGSDWVQAQRERFDAHYSTALGRAYASGLLGQGAEAKDRYDAGKRLARTRSRYYAHRRTRCALDTSPRGNVVVIVTEDELEQALADKQWLAEAERKIPPACAPYLDQLLSDIHTDAGPYWLTLLLETKPAERDRRDLMVLDLALRALDAIAPKRTEGIIRAIYG